MEPMTHEQHRWYARPVFFVTDVHRAAHFYIESLGFTKAWHSEDGVGSVCQVSRSDCEIILSEEPGRHDRARLFVELTAEGFAALERELEARGVPATRTHWGYDTIQVDDPDGNTLYFPRES